MILRRVIAHFRKQEWTAIALDFLIVVFGVFIGLQVNNWNAAQADARLGAEYTKRLARDLQQNLAIIRAEIAYYSSVLESVQLADALLRTNDSDPRALVINAYRASELSYSAPVRATWEEIVSTGHLDLLPEAAAESGLSQFYAFDLAQDVYSRGAESGYRQAVRRIIPIDIQVAMRASCSDVRNDFGAIVGFTEKCELDVDPADLKDVADALRSDPAVAAELRFQYSFAVSSVLNIGVLRSNLEQALIALGAPPETAEGSAP